MKSTYPSNQKFGYLFFGLFCFFSLYLYVKSGLSISFYSTLFISLFFLVASVKNLSILTPLNKAWFLLGHTLSKVVSPIVLGAIFFILITPIALIAKLLGRDELRIRRQKCSSYWVKPVASNLESESFKNQF